MSEQTELWTLEGVAKHFGVNERTVRRWIDAGCPVCRPSAGIIRFDLAEVIAWGKAKTPAPATADRQAV